MLGLGEATDAFIFPAPILGRRERRTTDRSNGIVSRIRRKVDISAVLPSRVQWPSIEWPIQLTTHAAPAFSIEPHSYPIHTCMKLCEEPFLGPRRNSFSVYRFFGGTTSLLVSTANL